MNKIEFKEDFNKESSERFNKELTAIYQSDPQDKDILIVIDSPGGYVDCLMHMVNIIQYMKSKKYKFTTYVTGLAASCGSVLFSLGDTRVMHPNAEILIHQISFGVSGELETVKEAVEKAEKVNDELFDILSKNLKYNKKKMLQKSKGKDWIIDAQEAKQLGFVHSVEIG